MPSTLQSICPVWVTLSSFVLEETTLKGRNTDFLSVSQIILSGVRYTIRPLIARQRMVALTTRLDSGKCSASQPNGSNSFWTWFTQLYCKLERSELSDESLPHIQGNLTSSFLHAQGGLGHRKYVDDTQFWLTTISQVACVDHDGSDGQLFPLYQDDVVVLLQTSLLGSQGMPSRSSPIPLVLYYSTK